MERNLRRIALCLLLAVIALVSCLVIADKVAGADMTSRIIASIDAKAETVMKLTASSTLLSAGVSAIPGDTATPIAEKLADFTKYFLLILCVLYTEKYLLTLIGIGFFRFLIPAVCLCLIIMQFWNPEAMKRVTVKIIAFGLICFLAIPAGILVSDGIYKQHEASITKTLAASDELAADTSGLSQAEGNQSLIEKWFSRISQTASGLTDKAANALNSYVETLAVLIVTSCIIPILILLLFIWVVKLIFGINAPVAPAKPRRRAEEE